MPAPRPTSAAASAPGSDLGGAGSIIVLAATDAPLLPNQCERLAQRAGLGIARTGGVGDHSSGDLFLAFATGNRGLPGSIPGVEEPLASPVRMLSNNFISPLFDAVVEATDEAIVNALLQAGTMTGLDGVTGRGPREPTSQGRPGGRPGRRGRREGPAGGRGTAATAGQSARRRVRMVSLMRRSSSTWVEVSWSKTWRRTSSAWAGAAAARASAPWGVSTA
jgi:Peptidase family S58